MSPLKCFNDLFVMENFFGIYRSYNNQKKTKQCFIIFLILVQTMLHTFIIFRELYILLSGEIEYSQVKLILAGFSASVYLSSVTSVMTGVCYSGAFISYSRSISRVSECFKDDKEFINSLKRTYRFSLGFILYSIGFAVFRSVDTFIKFSQLSPLILVPTLLSLTMTRISIVFQHLMLYVVVMIVVHLFKCLTSLVTVVQESVGSSDSSSDEQCDITGEQIQGWVELYRDLVNCCDKVMICFGRQFFLSVILSILHYILMAYYIFYKNVFNIGNTEERSRNVIALFGYILVMVMPLIAGQKAKNQGAKLHRALARLYNTMIIDSRDAEAKLIKDFIRLIKKNPLEIKLVSKVPAGMYMLPVILTLAVNYLIIMLQFNHII